MSTEDSGAGDGSAGGSECGPRLTQTNSVNPQSGADTDDLPTPEERVLELIAERPDLAQTPLASPGVTLREEAVLVSDADPIGIYDTVFGGEPDPENEIMGTLHPDSREDIRALTVAEAVYAFLCDYEESRGAEIYLEKAAPGGETVDTTTKPADNSFAPRYRKRRHAQLKGFEREIVTDFEEPVVALAGLTASGVGPDGLPRPPADHMREIAEAWSKPGGVRETLRNRLESGVGLEPDEWAYIRGGEPHPGDVPNRGYHHDHPAVVIDAAPLDGDGVRALRSAVKTAVRTHVAECPTAGPAAHEDAVERVERVDPESGEEADEITEVGAYVGSYIGGAYEEEPPEEPLSTVVWEATAWATTTQKFTAGRTARAMITADRCRQEAHDGDHGPHGAKLKCGTDAWGREAVECAYCDSHHDTPDTHDEARRSRAAVHRGDPLQSPGDGLPEGMECELDQAVARVGHESRERWCGHGWGGQNECPLCAEYVGAVPADVLIPSDAYDPALRIDRLDAVDPQMPDPAGPPEPVGATGPEYRDPTWTAIEYRAADGETYEIGAPGSVEYRTVTDGRTDRGRRLAVESLAEEAAGVTDEPGDADDTGGPPASGRRAVVDAVRGEFDGLSTATVAGRAGLDPETAEEWLDRLAREGTVRDTSDGWVTVGIA